MLIGEVMAATRDGANQRTLGPANAGYATFSADTVFIVRPQPDATSDEDGRLPFEIGAVSLTDGSSRTLATLDANESVLGLTVKADYLYFFRSFVMVWFFGIFAVRITRHGAASSTCTSAISAQG